MKNLLLGLNAILLVAVGVLYFFYFSDKKGGVDEMPVTDINQNAVIKGIAYVNSDTLLENYEYFKDKSEELEGKRKKLEAEFNNRAKGLETEIGNFQRNAQNMTIAQAKAVEEDLLKKQQNLLKYQEGLQQQLARDQVKVNNELYEQVSDFLNGYGKKRNFQIVLTYTKGSGVLYANDSLDITNEVISGLNKEYKKKPEGDTVATK